MKYFVVSQNLTKSGLALPRHAILRVNLAWHKDLASVADMLKVYSARDIFLDIPIGRKKPPHHRHELDDIATLANIFSNVKYVAISNVEDSKTIRFYSKKFKCKIVPKIETYKGVKNIAAILHSLNYAPAIIMLDHEDLFSNLVTLGKESRYLAIVDELVMKCRKYRAHLLRTKGIIFSSE